MVEHFQKLENLLTPMVFREPDLMTASSWQGHIPFAFWIVEAFRPKVLVELGSFSGMSYCAFCQAVKGLGIATSCYAVDTWEGDPHIGFYGEEVFKTLRDYHQLRYSAFSKLLRLTFDQALEHFSDGSIDLLHIDGYHTYEVIKHDFTSWEPKLSERAVVLFHDTNLREKDCGVWRFWEEITQVYPAFEFLHSEGLGVLAVGQHPADLVEWFVQVPTAAPQQVLVIREFFSRLGKVIVDNWSNREMNAQIAYRDNDIQTLNGMIASRDGDIQTLQGIIAARDGDIQSQQNDIQSWLQSQNQSLQNDIQWLQSQNQSLLAQLHAHQREIQSRQTEINLLQGEVAAREARIASISQSLSWKLTSPLRTVDRWLKIRNRSGR